MSETRIFDDEQQEYRPINRVEKVAVAVIRATEERWRHEPTDMVYLSGLMDSALPFAKSLVEAIDEGIRIYLDDQSDEQRRLLEEKIRRQKREIKELERQLGRRNEADA